MASDFGILPIPVFAQGYALAGCCPSLLVLWHGERLSDHFLSESRHLKRRNMRKVERIDLIPNPSPIEEKGAKEAAEFFISISKLLNSISQKFTSMELGFAKNI